MCAWVYAYVEEEKTACSLTDMNCVADDEPSCSITDMNCEDSEEKQFKTSLKFSL